METFILVQFGGTTTGWKLCVGMLMGATNGILLKTQFGINYIMTIQIVY